MKGSLIDEDLSPGDAVRLAAADLLHTSERARQNGLRGQRMADGERGVDTADAGECERVAFVAEKEIDRSEVVVHSSITERPPTARSCRNCCC